MRDTQGKYVYDPKPCGRPGCPNQAARRRIWGRFCGQACHDAFHTEERRVALQEHRAKVDPKA